MPLRILLLEDSDDNADLTLRELREEGLEFIVQRVETESDFRRQLLEFAPDLVLADYALPQYDGRTALAVAQEVQPSTPFIFVSGTMGDETAIDGLQHGATDYVLKQRLSRLGPAVRRALREVEDRRQREQSEKNRSEAQNRFRVLFEQSPDGIVILEPGTARILEFNEAAHRQLGYSRDEFARLTILDIASKRHPTGRDRSDDAHYGWDRPDPDPASNIHTTKNYCHQRPGFPSAVHRGRRPGCERLPAQAVQHHQPDQQCAGCPSPSRYLM